MGGPIIQTDVEGRLLDLADRLDREVERYADVSHERAVAEAAYKKEYAVAIVTAGNETVAMKEAHAQLRASDVFSDWKLAEAKEKATQQALIAIRTQMDALRTISANVRAMGG